MNQKNIFSAISVVLILQGIIFFAMQNKLVTDAFPGLDAACYGPLANIIEVMSALSILVGLIAWACRSIGGVVWAFTLGSLILLCVTLKHMFVDGIQVPIFAVAIQALIVLSCGYLWMQKPKA
jgi:hypothetical protein